MEGQMGIFDHLLNYLSAREKEKNPNSIISGIIDNHLTKNVRDEPYIQKSLENRNNIDVNLRVLKKTKFWEEDNN
jgi:hypothetical protein